ncbi:uncharacterized protein FFB14_15838 [Fusarium fujikuroi]|nr:uncharacterized protein FFB14_15838 [Fusarium fujikuroi]
MPFNLPFKWPS